MGLSKSGIMKLNVCRDIFRLLNTTLINYTGVLSIFRGTWCKGKETVVDRLYTGFCSLHRIVRRSSAVHE